MLDITESTHVQGRHSEKGGHAAGWPAPGPRLRPERGLPGDQREQAAGQHQHAATRAQAPAPSQLPHTQLERGINITYLTILKVEMNAEYSYIHIRVADDCIKHETVNTTRFFSF